MRPKLTLLMINEGSSSDLSDAQRFQGKYLLSCLFPASLRMKLIQIYFLFGLILFATLKPNGFVSLEQVNYDKKPGSKPATLGYNVNYVILFNWKKDLSNATRQIHSKNLLTKINLPAYALARESKTLFHFENVYVSKFGIVQNDQDLAIVKKLNHAYKEVAVGLRKNPDPMFYYNKIVMVYTKHSEYGHFIMDQVCALIQIPEEYFENAEIFINFPAHLSKTYCKVLGFNTSRIHQLETYYVFCKEVITLVSSDSVNSLLVCGMPLLRTKMYAALNLSGTIPTKYLFLNRKKGIWGRIQNVEELQQLASVKFPQHNWEIANESIVYSVAEVSKLLASTKLLITTAGSMNMNCIFMHPGCAVCACGSKVLDYPVLAVSYSLDLWCIYTNGHLLHGYLDSRPYPTDLFIESLGLLIEAQENGAWPKRATHNYLYTWPIRRIVRDITNNVPPYLLKPYYYYSERVI